jgi:hypothetical protein
MSEPIIDYVFYMGVKFEVALHNNLEGGSRMITVYALSDDDRELVGAYHSPVEATVAMRHWVDERSASDEYAT